MMKIEKKLLLCGIAPALLASCSQKQEDPNIVVMYIDDWDYSEIGAYNPEVYTPFIDSLMSESKILSRYYTAAPVSTPSRYSGLTGRYATCSSSFDSSEKEEPVFLRWNSDIIHSKDKTIASYLHGTDYRSGFVGKWHNGQPIPESELNNVPEDKPDLQGFLEKVYNLQRDYVQYNSDFDYAESIYANNLHVVGLPKSLQIHNMEWVTKAALDFIDQNKKNPFFLWFSTTIPHVPGGTESLYADPCVIPSRFLDEPIDVQPSRASVLERMKKSGRDMQHAGLLWLDDAFRTLYNKLEKEGKLENTIIIVASDNGEEVGKMTCYETAACIPAFVYWKGHIEPGVTEELMSNIDFLPTVADLAGIDLDQLGDDLPGKSWMPTLLEGKSMGRTSIYTEVVYQRAVVTKRWKYIATRFPEEIMSEITPENRRLYSIEGARAADRYGNDTLYRAYYDFDQLYDLENDPEEQNNLYGDAEYEDVKKEMRSEMKKYVSRLTHDFGEFKSEKE